MNHSDPKIETLRIEIGHFGDVLRDVADSYVDDPAVRAQLVADVIGALYDVADAMDGASDEIP